MDVIASTADPVVIILAAGLSSRMNGRLKPHLPWIDGKTLLEHQLHTVRASGLDAVLVAQAPHPGIWTVVNPLPERGLAESLQRGLSAIRRERGPAPVGVMLVDQPFISADDVAQVVDAFRRRPGGIHAIRPRYDGQPGHPLVFDATWDDLVKNLHGDAGLGQIWRGRTDAAWLDRTVGERPSPAFDVDTEESYRQALEWAR